MLKNFNKALNQKSQNPAQQLPTANQKPAAVATGAKTVASKGVSKHEQMELLNLLDKCTQIMKDDRLNLRNLIKDGQGQELEEIILKHKKKQDIQNLTLDLRKYLNKTKFRGGQTPSSNTNIAPTPNQKGSQVNLQQTFGDQRQSRKSEQDSIYRQQKTFTDALNVQQNNSSQDENMQFTFEQQRVQQQLQMQMRQQQQQLMQQQQLEQQIKQQNQYPQKMSPFRRPQQQQIQELNNTNSPLKQSNQNVFDQDNVHANDYHQQSYVNTSQSRGEQIVTEYNEDEDQHVLQMQQQSVQNQQVEVNENEESTLRKRLQETQNDEGNMEDEQQYNEQELQEDQDLEQQNQDMLEYQQQQEEVYQQQEEYQLNTQSQFSQNQLSELKQNQYESQQSQQAAISDSAMVTQNSQELTLEQQNQYLHNLESQQNYFQQQFSSQIRRSSMGQSEGHVEMSDQQMEQAIYAEQQRILQQEQEMERVKREREQYIQQAIQRSEQSRFGNFQNNREDCNNEENNCQGQDYQSCEDENESEGHHEEEFFDQINDLDQKEETLAKPNLLKLGSLQRGNSYQIADDPVTPMNHPVHMDSGVQYAPVKHRMEEMTESNDDPFSLQKRLSQQVSNVKSQYSDVKLRDENGEQRYQLDTQNSKRNDTQESGNKYNSNSYSQNKYNSVRKSNNDVEITTELIQHNFEVQMEKAYLEQQKLKSASRDQNNLFEEKSFSSAYGQQVSAEKQQFNHMNLFNCAMSGFEQESVQQPYSARKEQQQYDSKVIYNVDNYVRSATNQFTQPNEEIDDSCSINFANEKVELKYNVEEMLESSVRESNLQNAPQPTYMPKSEILKVFQNEQSFQQNNSYSLPTVNINNSTTLNVVQKTYDNYYAERVAIDLSGNHNLFQKKTIPSAPINIYSTPSQTKYQSVGVSQEQNSNGKIYSSSVLPPSILKSPAFRREYLRGTADPSANKDRVTSMLSPSREYQKLDPSKDPIKKKYNHLFTSPQLMKQCNVDFEKENIGISYSPESQKQFVNSERELIEQETKEFLKRSVERSAQRALQTNSNVFSSYEPQEIVTSRLRDSSIPKKSINFAKSPYSTKNLKESLMNTPNLKQSIQLPMFLTSASVCANTDKAFYVSRFTLYNKTAQEVFDIIFGNQIFQDKVTKMAFRNRLTYHYPTIPTNEIDGFFDFLDINQDQVLEVNEVGPVLMSICDYKSKENGKLIQVFNFLDVDRKGFITRLETEHLIHTSIIKKNYHNTALNLSKQQLQIIIEQLQILLYKKRLFKEVDIEQKGYLTYWELYSWQFILKMKKNKIKYFCKINSKKQESIKQLIDILTC
ncbi:hypothetical protein TTHERM_00131220 (macronuclear) [Tetrahymena thermophila SB210]|uniref:EF-hand domain-containing protein n=1 Tax=Tetrahymena thermophila (strain SB210) TaxID=312017 RepID=I7MF54_TETTS|nr:hypothetical protein TTHERM_00131220 [Tetrahymena thermophila SB210]EAR99354.3 hypothetical protein TTHERM_00131220 [Tetrahymena thermophila SB210]|eukprot:XP_001019599.3 hypothetical protein TTHERM_00131220 [Tetrahymena thermophila SB210]